ncbi:MAG TPA: DUF2752 domain-containing protein [Dermatophilaceae bacterium]|nr:DUF2752 domain-containing protein [Dermatophilaceae bacterium]
MSFRQSVAGLRWRAVGTAPLAVAGVALSMAAVLRVRDPHVPGSYGTCPFLALTGLPCPGCGGLRAVNDLTRGDLAGALGSNLYTVATLLAAALAWVGWVWSRAGGRRPRLGLQDDASATRLAVVWAAGLVVFAVLRWLPPFAVLRP